MSLTNGDSMVAYWFFMARAWAMLLLAAWNWRLIPTCKKFDLLRVC